MSERTRCDYCGEPIGMNHTQAKWHRDKIKRLRAENEKLKKALEIQARANCAIERDLG